MSECIDKHTERLDIAERCISEIEDKQVTVPATQKLMDKAMLALQSKAENLEAMSQCSSLLIVELAETMNIDNMERYVKRLFTDLLGGEPIHENFVMEGAHQSLAPWPVTGAELRPIIALLLKHRDRDAVL
ncbi:hypothetical protein NDU88_004465 [Pleurodeles waltl]|uniref:Uncharacterized protein n=1 Tax=Pleurodeles waltl TaxID=8319 RepID=A0AAV7T875_PLEWA|nr:hypothetical protein NDU88_004465 [Pleurodeles waltl]